MGKKDKKAKAASAAKAKAAKDGPAEEKQDVKQEKPKLDFVPRTGCEAAARSELNMDIRVNGIMLYGGKQPLLSDAVLAVNYGFKYGLVGRNGVGKTTLLRAISAGDIKLPEYLRVVHVEQEIVGDERSPLQTVLDADKERVWLLEQEARLAEEDAAEGEIDLQEVYERLEEMDSDNAEARAAKLLSGLGFDQTMQGKPTKEYSGGWRMRIALAEALFVRPDLLLLDEPTNHLDVHALTWLQAFLEHWDKSVVVVSHDRSFLNKTTKYTILCHRKRLLYYGGNYDTYLKVRAEHRANQASMAKTHSARTSALKSFIARFGQGHKKMAKQAQARMKMLSKMQEENCEVDFDDPYLRLDFPSAGTLPPPCISLNDVCFGYDGYDVLYEKLNFGLDCDSRVAIVGPNGAGKSTFLKLLDGTLNPTDGWISRHPKCQMARFTQHHIDSMDYEGTACDHMRALDKEVPVETARKYLGRFGLSGDLALQPIKHLSGGQKSRLAFAELAYRQPHILLLDEPTNHLDIETIEALAMAINQFDGGVVLVSHDERLLQMMADEIWVVNKGIIHEDGTVIPGTVTVFNGSFDEYRQALEEEFSQDALIAQLAKVAAQ